MDEKKLEDQLVETDALDDDDVSEEIIDVDALGADDDGIEGCSDESEE